VSDEISPANGLTDLQIPGKMRLGRTCAQSRVKCLGVVINTDRQASRTAKRL